MKETTFHLREHLLFALLTVLTLILCIGVGSVSIPFHDTAEIIFRAIAGWEQPSGSAVAIILYTRLPRVLCVALVLTLTVGYLASTAHGWIAGDCISCCPGCPPLMWTTGRSPSPWAWTSRAACMWNMKRP